MTIITGILEISYKVFKLDAHGAPHEEIPFLLFASLFMLDLT